MTRLLSSAFVVAVICGACASPQGEDGGDSVAAIGKQLASDTTLVRYLPRAEMKRRQGLFESRHPGWGVTRMGELTGAIGAEDARGPSTGPAAPALADDDYVYAAREFLVADVDLNGFAADELAKRAATSFVPDAPMADVYPDGWGGHEVVFYAPTHPVGFESYTSLSGNLAYVVRFGPNNAIVEIGTEIGVLDTRGLPSGVTLALPARPALPATDPTTTAEVLGRTLPSWNDGWSTWVPVRDVAPDDIAGITPTVLKKAVAGGIQLTLAYHIEVHAAYVAVTDPTIRITHELDFIVDGANGDLLAEDDSGVRTDLASNMLDVRCTSSVSYPSACTP